MNIGNAVDFDIPSTDNANNGSALEGSNLIYTRGSGTTCQPDYARYGGMALLGWYVNSDTASLSSSAAHSGHIRPTSEFVEPWGNFDPGLLKSTMSSSGFSVEGSSTDLVSVLTAVGDYDLSVEDTLWIYTAIATVQNGTSNNLVQSMNEASTWLHNYLAGVEGGCCGLYTGGFTGNVDCDEEGKRNLADITRLIDRVYITKAELCCEENGNVDADEEYKVNLADITRRIDHVYISKVETAVCK